MDQVHLRPTAVHDESQSLTPTGIDGFDRLIGGGFQKGSLIMLAGNPGTGKTVFATKFLCTGIQEENEAAIYVSLGENRQTLVDNMTRHFGPELGETLKSEKFRFLDFVIQTSAGLDAVLNSILEEVQKTGAKRLVIDSYSGMAQDFERDQIRTVLHAVLGKHVRDVGCTTLVISEVPRGALNLGVGVEEFVADGVIFLEIKERHGRKIREIEILKMRGSKLETTKSIFPLDGGFRVFKPTRIEQSKTKRTFKGITDPPDRFSTGLVELDSILDGGYVKGSTVLLEVDENISTLEYNMLTLPCIGNFLTHGKPVIDIPSVGVGVSLTESLMMQGVVTRDEVSELLKLCIPKEHLSSLPAIPNVWTFDGDDIPGSLERFSSMITELTQKYAQTSLYVEGIDTLFTSFGPNNVVKILNSTINFSRAHGNLNLLILRPGMPAPSLYRMLRSIADVHLKMVKEEGSLLLFGLKPWTGFYSVQLDVTRGFPWPRLVSMV